MIHTAPLGLAKDECCANLFATSTRQFQSGESTLDSLDRTATVLITPSTEEESDMNLGIKDESSHRLCIILAADSTVCVLQIALIWTHKQNCM